MRSNLILHIGEFDYTPLVIDSDSKKMLRFAQAAAGKRPVLYNFHNTAPGNGVVKKEH